MTTAFSFSSLGLAILMLAAGAVRAADAPAQAPVVMSPYEVSANSVSFQDWIKVGSPDFILYTDAKASEASKVLREFEMLHAASQYVFGRRAAHYAPTIVILPTARSDWRKLETKGGIEWKSDASEVGGLVVPVVVAQSDWQRNGLDSIRAVYSHVERDLMDLDGPFWFTQGFSAFYETAEFDGNWVKLGHASPRIYELLNRRWLPWDRFFTVNPESPEFTKEDLVGQYEAQAAIFTQFLFANTDRAWVGRLESWLDYLRTGAPPTEAQFAAIFGQDFKKWQDTLSSYLEGGSYREFRVTLGPEELNYQEKKFNLPVSEIRELFILTQTLLQAEEPQSLVSLETLLSKGLKSSCLRELLMDACLHWQLRDEALPIVRKLVAEGSTNARVYRWGDALLTAPAGGFGLDCRLGPEISDARAWDRQGLKLEPLYSDLWDSLAVNEACAPVVDQQSITTIEDCYEHMKGRAPTDEVITALAMALWRIGDSQTAGALAAKLKDDPLVRKRLRTMAGDLLERINTQKPASG